MKGFCLFLFFYFPLFVPAQNVESDHLTIRNSYGFIGAHTTSVAYISTSHFNLTELSYEKQTGGKHCWETMYNYPIIGVTGLISSLGQNRFLGFGAGIYPYVNFPLNSSSRLQSFLKFGSGIGYIQRPYSNPYNYKNIVIGSHLNALVVLQGEVRYRLSSKITASMNLGLSHFSNGSFKMPNMGINILSGGAGLSYQLKQSEIICKNDSLHKRTNKFMLELRSGLKEIYPEGGRKYFAASMLIGLNRQINSKYIIGGFAELFNDESLRAKLTRRGAISSYADRLRAGITFNQELSLSRLSIYFQMGAYVYDRNFVDGIFYHRLGYRYFFNDKIFGGLCLKTHFFNADIIEATIGYKLR